MDFGMKRNILRRLSSYGCRVIVVPAQTPAEEIVSYNPDGIFLSNGPGDPAAAIHDIPAVGSLLKSGKPIFGICMGHQILGLALGSTTFKLKFGHRGLNQPSGLPNRQVEITSQNHGFAIDPNSLDGTVEITHLNLNDSTVAGLRHRSLPFFQSSIIQKPVLVPMMLIICLPNLSKSWKRIVDFPINLLRKLGRDW
jgi:carbamoyl-phosphate synthase small subunit